MPVYWHTRTANIEQVKYKGINVLLFFVKNTALVLEGLNPNDYFFTLPSKQKYKSMIYN